MSIFAMVIRDQAGLQMRCAMAANETMRSKTIKLRDSPGIIAIRNIKTEHLILESKVLEQTSPPHLLMRNVYDMIRVQLD
mgnify:CR=1 FL=1